MQGGTWVCTTDIIKGSYEVEVDVEVFDMGPCAGAWASRGAAFEVAVYRAVYGRGLVGCADVADVTTCDAELPLEAFVFVPQCSSGGCPPGRAEAPVFAGVVVLPPGASGQVGRRARSCCIAAATRTGRRAPSAST